MKTKLTQQELNFYNALCKNLDEFYEYNQYQIDNGNYKKYLKEYKNFTKQYNYDFELMKDIDNYLGVENELED